jgi:hypothetical protein
VRSSGVMTWNPEMGFMVVARGKCEGSLREGGYWERAMMPRR